jgi:hypothetical protein
MLHAIRSSLSLRIQKHRDLKLWLMSVIAIPAGLAKLAQHRIRLKPQLVSIDVGQLPLVVNRAKLSVGIPRHAAAGTEATVAGTLGGDQH